MDAVLVGSATRSSDIGASTCPYSPTSMDYRQSSFSAVRTRGLESVRIEGSNFTSLVGVVHVAAPRSCQACKDRSDARPNCQGFDVYLLLPLNYTNYGDKVGTRCSS
jgi:hypothetical protein